MPLSTLYAWRIEKRNERQRDQRQKIKVHGLAEAGTAALSFQSTTSARTLTANDIALSTKMPSDGILSPS